MPQIGDTYTQKVNELRSQVGDNPEAIRRAFAQQSVAQSQPLQESIGNQRSAIEAMAAADKNLAQQYTQNTQAANQQTQQIQGLNSTLAGMTNYSGTNPQDIIAKAAATPMAQYGQVAQQYSQPTGLVSPFALSQAANTQVATQGQAYDLAAQQRGSLERAIGTEADSVAKIAQYQMEAERLQREYEAKVKAEEENRKRLEYEDKRQYATLMGGSVTNPFTGQTEKYPTPEEKEAQKSRTGQSVFQKTTANGKSFYDEVIDGQGSFKDVVDQNPGLTDDEKVALAKLNVDKFGPFKETTQQLIDAGLGWVASAKLNQEEQQKSLLGSTTTNGSADAYAELISTGKMTIANVPAEIRDAVVRSMISRKTSGAPKVMSEQEKLVSNLIDEIKLRDTKPLTGVVRAGLINPFYTAPRATAEKLKQLSGSLQLAAAGQLKGQGAISENERKILSDSVSALGLKPDGTSNLSDEDVRRELTRIQDVLAGKYSTGSFVETDASVDSDPMGIL